MQENIKKQLSVLLVKSGNPILFQGLRGLGKGISFFASIKYLTCGNFECPCESCSNLKDNQDILVITGEEPSEELSHSFHTFIQGTPLSLPFRFIYLNNLDYWSKSSQNLLLQTVESLPLNFRLFGACEDLTQVSDALISRFFCLKFTPFSNKSIEEHWRQELYFNKIKEIFDIGFEIQSSFFVENYRDFSFYNTYQNLFQSGDINKSILDLKDFFKALEELSGFDKNRVLSNFIDYALFKLKLELGPSNTLFLEKIINKYSGAILNVLKKPSLRYTLNIENQFNSLCLTLFTLRKILKK